MVNLQRNKFKLSLTKSAPLNVDMNPLKMVNDCKMEEKDDECKDFDDDEGETVSNSENRAGVSSLHNLGNTCFLNSIIQILRYTPNFTSSLLNLSKEIEDAEDQIDRIINQVNYLEVIDKSTTWKFVKNLAAIYKRMNAAEKGMANGSSSYLAIRPYELLDTLEQLNPMFEGNLQQDAHEFLCCIFSYLQEAVKVLNNFYERISQLFSERIIQRKSSLCSNIPIHSQNGNKIASNSYINGFLHNGKDQDFVPENKKFMNQVIRNDQNVSNGSSALRNVKSMDDIICNDQSLSKESCVTSNGKSLNEINVDEKVSGLLKRKRSSSDEDSNIKQTFKKITNFFHIQKAGCDPSDLKDDSSIAKSPFLSQNGLNPETKSASFSKKQKARKSFTNYNSENSNLNYDKSCQESGKINSKSLSDLKVDLCSKQVDVYFQDKEIELLKSATNEFSDDFIQTLFQGKLSVRTKCLECEKFKERSEKYQDVSVAVRKPVSDYDTDDEDEAIPDSDNGCKWITSALKETDLLKGPDKYFCDSCFALNEAQISTHYLTNPPILTVHMKRFAASSGWFGSVSKINDDVPIPMILPCIKDLCGKDCPHFNHRYELYGVVTHTGISISSGHYVAYVKSSLSELMQSRMIEEMNSSAMNRSNFNQNDQPADPNNNMDDNNNLPSTDIDNAVMEIDMNNSDFDKFNSQIVHDSDWLEFDDDNIRLLSRRQFEILMSNSKLGAPYMLFYKIL